MVRKVNTTSNTGGSPSRRLLRQVIFATIFGTSAIWFASIYSNYYERVDIREAVYHGHRVGMAVEPFLFEKSIPRDITNRVEQLGRVTYQAVVDPSNGVVSVRLPTDTFGNGEVILTPRIDQASRKVSWSCYLSKVKSDDPPPECSQTTTR